MVKYLILCVKDDAEVVRDNPHIVITLLCLGMALGTVVLPVMLAMLRLFLGC